MLSNRALALLLLFILIPTGLLAIFRSNLPFFLRKDPVPSGAYIVPWMVPTQSISSLYATPPQSQPWNLSTIMQGALKFDITFNIAMPNGTRTIRSTIYLGHDQNLLYAGGIFRGMYSNPASQSNDWAPQYLNILLDVDNDGVISAPESGSTAFAFVPCPFQPSQCGLGADGWGSADVFPGYHDLAWDSYVPEYGHGFWALESQVCNQPSTLAGIATEYNNITGDLVLIFARRLSQPNSCADALQMRPSERWVMGFLFELGYQNGAALLSDYVDGWPLKAYPYLSTDSSSWPKLAIDLATPSSPATG